MTLKPFEKVKAAVFQSSFRLRLEIVSYGEPAGTKVMTTLFKDPDGIVVQLISG
jgi:hypothetical protein